MKCSTCKYWQKSKLLGNHCKFLDGVKPCEFDRRNKHVKAKRDKRRKKMEKYDKSNRKVRYDDN